MFPFNYWILYVCVYSLFISCFVFLLLFNPNAAEYGISYIFYKSYSITLCESGC